uniref:Uncharacterized protein n=2 Tax=Colletotrichum scovillei TaxID=1209932 RepID=A0A9P7R5A0_9PEZI
MEFSLSISHTWQIHRLSCCSYLHAMAGQTSRTVFSTRVGFAHFVGVIENGQLSKVRSQTFVKSLV